MNENTNSNAEPQYRVPQKFDGSRLDFFLAAILERSRPSIRQLFDSHDVFVNKKKSAPGKKVAEGDAVGIAPRSVPSEPIRQLFHLADGRPVRILYETDALWVIDKPPGVSVNDGKTSLDSIFRKSLERRRNGIDHWRFVHR